MPIGGKQTAHGNVLTRTLHVEFIAQHTRTLTHTHTGAGFGQVYAVGLLSTYYASLMALIVSYLIDSFKSPLPWTDCQPEWSNCVAASATGRSVGALESNTTNPLFASINQTIQSGDYGFGNLSMALNTANGSSKAGTKVMGSSEYYFM